MDYDPTYRIRFRPKLIGHRARTDTELGIFEQLGTLKRLRYVLALYTGTKALRRSCYGSRRLSGRRDRRDTGKDRRFALDSCPSWLVEAIDATPQCGPWLICSRIGNRYTIKSFVNLMADAIKAVELPSECRLHGLRKSVGCSLAEDGCTTRQIAAILGYNTLSETERYTREAD